MDQLPFDYTSGRAANIAVLIFSEDLSKVRTSGTTMSTVSAVADAVYAAGRLTATEYQTSSSTGTGNYITSALPSLADGVYKAAFYDVATPGNASPSPSTQPLFTWRIKRDGSDWFLFPAEDVAGGGGGDINVNPSLISSTESPEFVPQNVKAGEVKPIPFVYSDVDYTGITLKLRVRDHQDVQMFELTGTVSTTTTTGDTVTFTTTAANTTTDLDAQVSPVRAAACDRTSLRYTVIQVVGSAETAVTEGILRVGRAA